MKDEQNSILINTYRLIKSTRAEGPGTRVCIWFQGCSRHCDGCMAYETWSHETNKLVPLEEIKSAFSENPDAEGITVLGGEPFEQAEELAELLKMVKSLNKSAVVFTGNTIEVLRAADNTFIAEALENIDVLVDGEYDKTKRSFDMPMIGSSNQRFHFLTDRYSIKDFGKNKVELIISKDGSIKINGMGDFEKIYNKR